MMYTPHMKKPRVLILCGGVSAEHEVSLRSAANIVRAMDDKRWMPQQVVIGKDGVWRDGKKTVEPFATIRTADVVFPVLHGTNGEDGTIQGLLRIADVPFVGPDVLGSAVGMDKDVAKRLLRDSSIPVVPFMTVTRTHPISYAAARRKLGTPLFVKPANCGSSVGVSKATDARSYARAVAEALRYDTKALVEQAIAGREIECAVLGNETPEASVLGELVIHHDFYSYDAKYNDPDGATPVIPAAMPKATARKMRDLAVRAVHALQCEGMTRVDFFLTTRGAMYVNEVNTIPGFTDISMYPKLWEASGLSQRKLVTRLLELAIERHAREMRLTHTLS